MSKDESDVERQFREDLEKAQALSLESLALENFRKQKQQQQLSYLTKKAQDPSIKGTSSKNVIYPQIPSFTNELTGGKNQALRMSTIERSPGVQLSPVTQMNSDVPRIKPPPPVARRSSSVSSHSISASIESNDLISFNSPDPFSKRKSDLDDLSGLSLSNNDCDSADGRRNSAVSNQNVSLASSSQSFESRGEIGFRKELNFSPIGFNHSDLSSPLSSTSLVPSYMSTPSSATISFCYPNFFLPSASSDPLKRPIGFTYPCSSSNTSISPNSSSYLNFNSTPSSSSSHFPTLSAAPKQVFANSIPPSTSSFCGQPMIGPPVSSSDLSVLKVVEKRPNSNLIDLTPFDVSGSEKDPSRVKVSILEAFDPLLSSCPGTSTVPEHSENIVQDDVKSESSGSFYDAYDHFEYLYSPVIHNKSCSSDPIYASPAPKNKSIPNSPLASPAPPLPVRALNDEFISVASPTRKLGSNGNSPKQNTSSNLYENIGLVKRKSAVHDADLVAFHALVKSLRSEFVHSDFCSNAGLVMSSLIESSYESGTSIKLVVYCQSVREAPVTFTCDVTSSIEHVTMHVLCELDAGKAEDFVLKVYGLAEYFSVDTSLADYEFIHNCIKLEKDVVLSLVPLCQLDRPLARTSQDDERDSTLTLDDLLPKEPVQPISHESLQILLETLDKEMSKLEKSAVELSFSQNSTNTQLHPRRVIQAVKAICALLGNLEPLEMTFALDQFVNTCSQYSSSSQTHEDIGWTRPEIIRDDGDYSVVKLKNNLIDSISSNCERIRVCVHSLIDVYCRTFRVDFQVNTVLTPCSSRKPSSQVLDSVLVHVGALHRLNPAWNYDEYLLAGQIYHGTRPITNPVLSKPVAPSESLYKRLVFDFWLNFEGTSVCVLPRESRLVIVIYGRTLQSDNDLNAEPTVGEHEVKQIELGWVAIQFFDCESRMAQGCYLLCVWPPAADRRLGPAPGAGTHPFGDVYPIIGIELPDYGANIVFPELPEIPLINPSDFDFQSLDFNTQQQLTVIEQDIFTRPSVEDREVLWEKRHYLLSKPRALPKVFLAAHSWDYACITDLLSLLNSWATLEPVEALQLLLPCFANNEVRNKAVSWIDPMCTDELIDYLPQLVQALKHETYEKSHLAKLLLKKSLMSPRFAHHLYWLLTQALPGQSPQNSGDNPTDEGSICNARYHRRLQLMLRALLAVAGEALRKRFMSQQLLVKNLYDAAENIKITKESFRLKTLLQDLEYIHHSLEEAPTCLPLSPSLEVCGIQINSCSYFPSNTLPLKINFLSCEDNLSTIPAIFKVGDDLQQDMLTIQMIRIMDKLWLKEGLDLKIVTFECVPTGSKRGMIEMVTEADTLRKIQVEFGLTGSFKDKPIAEWLAKHNPSTLEYERAVQNFTASCAGYSVATYILGICDRHNDNIMLKTSGHLFHIDFGKFLGDAQMFGNFKRDRTPFVLTSDMAYVINGGDKPTVKFHHFVDLCCQAFNIIRKHNNHILTLFGLMASSGIPGVTMDAVQYVQKALLPQLSNPEAAAAFAKMIESSLKSWFTQFNFFLHNLAQLRFSGDHNGGELLSFIPRVYTLAQDGRIQSVRLYGYQKRYDPEKYYVYILKVERVNQPDPTFLFRSYKEFCEFQQKLCIHFPLARCYSLQSSSLHVGRSNIKQVAEKRCHDIKKFLVSLFEMADEICHSDLVYTFFHPVLRDQQEASIHDTKLKGNKKRATNSELSRVRGSLKLSMQYQRGIFVVMVHHIKELSALPTGQEPSTYVKVYLLPDPSKMTKRKTKVVRKNCHPSFMEMLEYRMPIEMIQTRVLQATVWNHDTLQENEFLGGVTIPLQNLDLSKETVSWHTLGNILR
ncbi:unnamed protein product [Bemisia tabaci]|uniref:Phosphatidylinositol-4-phosphate 3-kinase n=1 Tax=Bemisia tabaci TaxID=7038 RepID=A0A9P0AG24_BEMTA|nr:unnamed protein product [Bemisia tabaci]